MESRTRSAIVSGAILIVIGVLLLVARLVPGLFQERLTWPFFVIGVGAAFLLFALLTQTPGLAVPGCIVGGIGLILWWQNRTGDWETWAYAWTLIPGFVGVGVLVTGLLEGKPLKALFDALWPIMVSAVLFVVFSSSFGGPLQGQVAWPYLAGGALILGGVLVILRPLVKTGKK